MFAEGNKWPSKRYSLVVFCAGNIEQRSLGAFSIVCTLAVVVGGSGLDLQVLIVMWQVFLYSFRDLGHWVNTFSFFRSMENGIPFFPLRDILIDHHDQETSTDSQKWLFPMIFCFPSFLSGEK